ncbi:MAG TPA: succinate dehydrogenase, partial [Armatimonadota bacterium]|nr:succinate dehydrogenase [Armatimonadota bacterium]
ALYIALVFLVILWIDAIRAFWWGGRLGMGLGSLIMVASMVLLTGYTLGCHSLRHLVGGRLDCFTCPHVGSHQPEGQVRPGYRAWRFVSRFNAHHMEWAWSSLISVALTDLYIRSCAAGIVHDLRFF